jgi:hypothetical protein
VTPITVRYMGAVAPGLRAGVGGNESARLTRLVIAQTGGIIPQTARVLTED